MMLKKGVKRIFTVMMLSMVPFAASEPISVFQEAVPFTQPQIIFKEPVPARALQTKKQKPAERKWKEVRGVASWYSQTDPAINKHTANGEVFNDRDMTCASWNHPFGTKLKVTNLQNKKSVVCRVNDRGPAKRLKREIDLTLAAFKKISSPAKGLIKVSVRKLPGPASARN